MIRFVQNKKIDFKIFKDFISLSERNNQFTNKGPVKFKLESTLHKILELPSSKSVVCTSNGTSALHALMFYYEKKAQKDIKWASPSFTFPSCVVNKMNTEILDIDPDTKTLPLTDEILDCYDGFIITNLFGSHPPNIGEWISRCSSENKILIFDNASSPLTKYSNNNICSLGTSSFGSLHHTKFLGFGEGGFAVIDKSDVEEFNSLLGFGFNGIGIHRIYDSLSSNYKISDISCAAIMQHVVGYNIDRHKQIQDRMVNFVKKNFDSIDVLCYNKDVVYGNLPLVYNKNIDHLFFKDMGIEAHKYYYPLSPNHENSMNLYNRMVNLPLYADMTDFEIQKIQNTILKSLKNNR